jgi:hypothetical protein
MSPLSHLTATGDDGAASGVRDPEST